MRRWRTIVQLILALVFAAPVWLSAQTTDDCMMCHEDPTLVSERTGHRVNVILPSFQASVHGALECVDCHADLSGAEFPHEPKLAPVDCGLCHEDVAAVYGKSMHGRMAATGAPLAPRCWDCHGSHDIFARTDLRSHTYPANVQETCLRCHTNEEMAKLISQIKDPVGIFYMYSLPSSILQRKVMRR